MNHQPTKGGAFLKGGIGCLFIFAGLAFLAFVFGGEAHADAGGLVLLFIFGGVLGLIIFLIFMRGYRRGRKDAGGRRRRFVSRNRRGRDLNDDAV